MGQERLLGARRIFAAPTFDNQKCNVSAAPTFFFCHVIALAMLCFKKNTPFFCHLWDTIPEAHHSFRRNVILNRNQVEGKYAVTESQSCLFFFETGREVKG